MTSKIEVKLFAGFYLTPDLIHQLKSNSLWKLSRVAINSEDLIEVHEDKRDYVGIYLKENKTTYNSLKETEKELKNMLQHYLPSVHTHDLHLEIFSKLFVL